MPGAGVVRRAPAEIDRERRAGVPGDGIEQAQIPEGLFFPAVIGPAIALSEGQLVGGIEAELVAHVERRQATLGGIVSVLLHDDAAAAPDGAGVIKRLRPGVLPLKGDSMRKRCARRTCRPL